MDNTTLTDLSQPLLQSDSSHLVPKKAKRKEPFLLRLMNKVHSKKLRGCLLLSFYPWKEHDISLSSAMEKVGLLYFPDWFYYELEVPIELEAYYILLIEVMFKEKISTYSKEEFWWDYLPTWNKKFLELYNSCTESELIKIAFLVTYPLVTIKRMSCDPLLAITQNLRVIFAKNSPPEIDILATVADNRKTNPFLGEIERDGYLEECIQPIIISLASQCLTKKLLNPHFYEYDKYPGFHEIVKREAPRADIILQLISKFFLKDEKECCKFGQFTYKIVSKLRNTLTSFDILSVNESDFADLKSSFFNSNADKLWFAHDSFKFLQAYVEYIINVKTLLPNSFEQIY